MDFQFGLDRRSCKRNLLTCEKLSLPGLRSLAVIVLLACQKRETMIQSVPLDGRSCWRTWRFCCVQGGVDSVERAERSDRKPARAAEDGRLAG